MKLPLPPDLARVLETAPALRNAYLVGGSVRDALLDRPVKDFDFEVFGIGFADLAEALRPFGRVDLVGQSFGVAKLSLSGAIHDFSIPRRDSKTGPGHRGFAIEQDPTITPREAASRRDFTINALMLNPRTGELLDFFGGERDLRGRILRHTSPSFVEDPLRVLRGMQFASRFNLQTSPDTLALCREMLETYGQLAIERIREEWFKWATRSERPSVGLQYLRDTGWIAHFPELAAIQNVPQEPEWHPEGDVFTHTGHCLDALVRLPEWASASDASRLIWAFAVLTHDFGKAQCTQVATRHGRDRIISPGHERLSGQLAESFLQRLRAPRTLIEHVVPLVVNHMSHFEDASERAVRRLARRLHPETVERLCVVMTADAHGRPPKPAQIPEGVRQLRQMATSLRLADAAPKPVLLGRHLLALGLAPGPDIGHWTKAAFEAQLDGQFHDVAGAHRWLATQPGFPEEAARSAAQFTMPESNGTSEAASKAVPQKDSPSGPPACAAPPRD